MPVQVEMRINGHIIDVLHIGRIEGEPRADSINTYWAVVRKPGEQPDWYADDVVELEHRYGDMLQELVRKALNAIYENNMNEELDIPGSVL
jgi:hypothetical protein